MVEMRIERKPAFRAAGTKVWISGQDNELFGKFWDELHENGTVALLRSAGRSDVTGSRVFGVSRVEKDPNDRAFWFYIATQCDGGIDGFEAFDIPECTWAIFSNRGTLPMSLVEAEMKAFMEWLPGSNYAHAAAPELEVYPDSDAAAVEFWLPVIRK